MAEGGSAAEIRLVMHPSAELVLIDPYPLSRLPGPMRFTRHVAHRVVSSSDRGTVTWIDDYSVPAAQSGERPIDFLFIDGDHSVEGAMGDWDAWAGWVQPGGVVVLHDSRPGAAPWITEDAGPVQVVRRALEGTAWGRVDEVDSMTVLQRLG